MKDSPTFDCPECGFSGMVKMIPKNLNFMLKGTNWSGKNAKEKSFRSSRNKEMGRRMAENHNIPQIQPNYKGEVVDSWDQAKKLAKEDGVNTSTYDKQVEQVNAQNKRLEDKKQKLLRGEA
jgi:predicted nucleic acid-binding Zn ribbon protein